MLNKPDRSQTTQAAWSDAVFSSLARELKLSKEFIKWKGLSREFAAWRMERARREREHA
jgi:hypothetical protein